MGRHDKPDRNRLSPPILRVAGPRARSASDQTIPGVRFPIVDDLSQIAADDQLLDSIAAGRTDFADLFDVLAPLSPSESYPSTGPQSPRVVVGSVAPLLATWRSEIVSPPMPVLPPLAVVKRVMSGPPTRSRQALRHILGVAAAICALLLGSAAVGAHSAQPGEPLWGLNVVLYADHAASVKAGMQAKANMSNARALIAKGIDVQEVRKLLISAQGNVEEVSPSDGKQVLQKDLAQLFTEAASVAAGGTASAGPSTPEELAIAAGVSGAATSSIPTTVSSTSSSPTRTSGSTAPATSAPIVAPSLPLSTTSGLPAPPVSVPTSGNSSPVGPVGTGSAATTTPTTIGVVSTSQPVTTGHPVTGVTGVAGTTVSVTVLPVITVPVSSPAVPPVPVTLTSLPTLPATSVITVTVPPVTSPSTSTAPTTTSVTSTPDSPDKTTSTPTGMSTTSALPSPSAPQSSTDTVSIPIAPPATTTTTTTTTSTDR